VFNPCNLVEFVEVFQSDLYSNESMLFSSVVLKSMLFLKCSFIHMWI